MLRRVRAVECGVGLRQRVGVGHTSHLPPMIFNQIGGVRQTGHTFHPQPKIDNPRTDAALPGVVPNLELQVLDDRLHDRIPLLPQGREAVGRHAYAAVLAAAAALLKFWGKWCG